MKKRYGMKHGGSHDGNALARREKFGMGGYGMKRKQAAMGRYMYGHGGMSMEGSQPKYKGTPTCKPN